ncbi:hypothetical protein D1007_52012 [Hordeum vulgare]|nr:hypothetical protein D1007_52012 [Hordeum vulgare]
MPWSGRCRGLVSVGAETSAILATAGGASACAIGDKCTACKDVAAELEIGISSEKPRNHFDLRKSESGEKEWVKVENWSSFQTDKKAAARAHSKNLSS